MSYVDEATFTNHTALHEVLGTSHVGIQAALATYSFFLVLIGVGGNFIVLYGSIRHNAIQMDKTSVTILRHIAFADLTCTALFYLPKLTALLAGRWVLGPALCYSVILRAVPLYTETMLVALLSCHRVYALWSPLQGGISRTIMRRLVAVVWAYNGVLSIAYTVGPQDVRFEYKPLYLDCSKSAKNSDTHPTLRILGLTIMIGNFFLPIAVTVLANISIFSFVRNAGFKAVKTISLICWIFVLSNAPWLVVMLVDNAPWFTLFATYTFSLTMISNPFIYSATNVKFNYFLKMLFRCDLRGFGRRWNLQLKSGSNDLQLTEHADTVQSQHSIQVT